MSKKYQSILEIETQDLIDAYLHEADLFGYIEVEYNLQGLPSEAVFVLEGHRHRRQCFDRWDSPTVDSLFEQWLDFFDLPAVPTFEIVA